MDGHTLNGEKSSKTVRFRGMITFKKEKDGLVEGISVENIVFEGLEDSERCDKSHLALKR